MEQALSWHTSVTMLKHVFFVSQVRVRAGTRATAAKAMATVDTAAMDMVDMVATVAMTTPLVTMDTALDTITVSPDVLIRLVFLFKHKDFNT